MVPSSTKQNDAGSGSFDEYFQPTGRTTDGFCIDSPDFSGRASTPLKHRRRRFFCRNKSIADIRFGSIVPRDQITD
jgi:hypothetical protein